MRIQVTLVAIAVASGAALFASEAAACEDQKDKSSASAEYDQARASDLQRALRDAGYYEGAIDGRLDRDVRQALIRFQNDKGFVPSGRIDPRTRRALKIDGVEDEIRRVRGVDDPAVEADDVGNDVQFERPWERAPFALDDPKTLTPDADPIRIPMPEPEEPELDMQSGEDLLDDAARNEAMKEAMKDAGRDARPIDDDTTTPVSGGATVTEPTKEETSDEGANGE